MKRSVSFSLEENLCADFLKETGDKKNFVLEKIIFDFLSQKKEVKTIVCKTCNATYSEKLPYCPQCKMNENLLTAAEKHKLTIDQMLKRLSMLEKIQAKGGFVTDKEINELREKIKIEEQKP